MSSPPMLQNQDQSHSQHLIQQLSDARAAEKRARNELVYAERQVETFRKACDRALFDEAKDRIITEGGLNGVVSDIEITPTGHCKVYFADDVVACGTVSACWRFTIDRESYMVDWMVKDAKQYKHKLKKVRETINRLSPHMHYVCERLRELSEYTISDLRSSKLRKLEEPTL